MLNSSAGDSPHLHPLRRARRACALCFDDVRAERAPWRSVGSMGASGARSACTSPIFVRCASPPGTARATLRALLRPARAPRGSTRAVLAGREARADPGGAPARARRPRRLSEGGAPRVLHAPPTRTGILGVGVGLCVLRVAPHRSHKGFAQFARFAHCFVIQSLWGSQIYFFIF